MKKKRKVSIIGLWILVAMIGIYLGISYLKGLSVFRNSNSYYVRFPNVSSVAIASPVMINGYKVGSVQGLDFQLENDGSTVLTLEVKRKYKLPKGTLATVKQGLLGGSEIALTLGQSNEILSHLDTIGILPGNPDYMEMLNNQVIPQVMAMLPKADSILNAINDVTHDPAIARSVREFEKTVLHAKASMVNLQEATTSIRAFSNTDLPKLSENLQRVSNNLVAISNAIDSTQLASSVADLSATVENLKGISQNISSTLEDKNNTVGALINEKELYFRIDSLVKSADALVTDIKKNPKRYLKISIF